MCYHLQHISACRTAFCEKSLVALSSFATAPIAYFHWVDDDAPACLPTLSYQLRMFHHLTFVGSLGCLLPGDGELDERSHLSSSRLMNTLGNCSCVLRSALMFQPLPADSRLDKPCELVSVVLSPRLMNWTMYLSVVGWLLFAICIQATNISASFLRTWSFYHL